MIYQTKCGFVASIVWRGLTSAPFCISPKTRPFALKERINSPFSVYWVYSPPTTDPQVAATTTSHNHETQLLATTTSHNHPRRN
ncbi:unnamed protein product [Prunus armeniaca]